MTENKRFVAIGVEWVDGFIQDHIGDRDLFNVGAVCNLLNELSEENEHLKETINELRDMDKEKDIEIEHINNIYKEFGFKGIIDYAKDKLQCYGTVREVDNGLWLLATGGWSDNEFWLNCLLNWNFMYAKRHYRATTRGGGYYYTENPYEDIEIKKRQIKG